MSTVPGTAARVMTGDEFLMLYGDRSGFELVNGQVVELPMPGAKHGEVCITAGSILRGFVKPRRLGRVMSNDTFVRTRTDPDGCRGADVVFVSYAALPADVPTPSGALGRPVDLVVEVRSPSNTVAELTNKATEYVDAGVTVVLVLDPDSESATVHRGGEIPQRFHNGDVLALPDILPGFAVPVKEFFE